MHVSLVDGSVDALGSRNTIKDVTTTPSETLHVFIRFFGTVSLVSWKSLVWFFVTEPN